MATTTYRQVALHLRISRPGEPDINAIRPHRRTARGPVFTDSDEAPTLIELDPEWGLDIDHLLRAGAIVAWPAPSRPAHRAATTADAPAPAAARPETPKDAKGG